MPIRVARVTTRRLLWSPEDAMQKVTLRKVGGSLGVELPNELLERLQVAEGDDLCLVESEDGATLTRCEPHLDRAMEFYREGARKYRNALRELAQ